MEDKIYYGCGNFDATAMVIHYPFTTDMLMDPRLSEHTSAESDP